MPTYFELDDEELQLVLMWRRDKKRVAPDRSAALRSVLENIVDVYDARVELFTNDKDLADSLYDRARLGLMAFAFGSAC